MSVPPSAVCRITFVTNSLANARGHELLAQWAYESQLRSLADAGAEVWEVKGPRVMHAKTVVADRRHVYIGSFNMDQRSRRLQKETGILADSPELAEQTIRHGQTLRAGALLAAPSHGATTRSVMSVRSTRRDRHAMRTRSPDT